MQPKHELIKDDILDKIVSGEYEIGKIIPSEKELAEQYGVSRPTVSQAIRTLVTKGFLERKQRKGTIVISRKITQEFTYNISSFNSEMLSKGVVPKTKIISIRKMEPSDEVKDRLQLVENELVFQLVRLRYVDKNPVVIVTTYIPESYLPDFLDYDFEKQSLYEVLDNNHYKVTSIDRTLEIITSDELSSTLLNVPQGDPLFYFKSIGKTKDDIYIEYSIARYRSDINTFNFKIEIN